MRVSVSARTSVPSGTCSRRSAAVHAGSEAFVAMKPSASKARMEAADTQWSVAAKVP